MHALRNRLSVCFSQSLYTVELLLSPLTFVALNHLPGGCLKLLNRRLELGSSLESRPLLLDEHTCREHLRRVHSKIPALPEHFKLPVVGGCRISGQAAVCTATPLGQGLALSPPHGVGDEPMDGYVVILSIEGCVTECVSPALLAAGR